MRSLLTAFLRWAVRLFYRRVDVVGLENIPADRGVVFAANHPNGLVDPLFILCFVRRPVSFLAKAPLFRYPFVGWFVRRLNSIPVYRRQDATTGSNQETFARAREIIAERGCIAIFPEGTTHSDPRLRELKTGAARIALGVASVDVAVVPVGIDYTAKQTFRSSAVVSFGTAIEVPRRDQAERGEPDAEDVERLTDAIRRGLDAVTLQADSAAALQLIARAERIFSIDADRSVAEALEIRRRFVEGYHYLSSAAPERLAQLTSMVERFEAERDAARLDPETLEAQSAGEVAKSLAIVLILFPLAMAGAVLNFPAYRIIAALSATFSKGEDEMAATMKFVGALLLYPALWLVEAAIIERFAGIAVALMAAIAIPILGWVALRFFETIDSFVGRARSLTRRLFRSHAIVRLEAQRAAIRREIFAIGQEMESAAVPPRA